MPTCSGSSKSPGVPCICTSFIPRSPPKENKCNICGHRRSAHTDHTDSTSGASGKYVNRLLKNIVATAVHEEARKETIQGFRPRPQQYSSTTTATVSTISSQKGKGKNTRRTSTRITSTQSSGNVKIGRIIIFPCGAEVSSVATNTLQYLTPFSRIWTGSGSLLSTLDHWPHGFQLGWQSPPIQTMILGLSSKWAGELKSLMVSFELSFQPCSNTWER